MEWQPIETAPDETDKEVLISAILPWHGYRIDVAWRRVYGGWQISGGRVPYDPTHWMPLPEPPET